MNIPTTPPAPVFYPDSDGKPMADNTRQLRWITTLYDNLSALFHDRPDVFVAADLLWYPVEGQLEVRMAPDMLVVGQLRVAGLESRLQPVFAARPAEAGTPTRHINRGGPLARS